MGSISYILQHSLLTILMTNAKETFRFRFRTNYQHEWTFSPIDLNGLSSFERRSSPSASVYLESGLYLNEQGHCVGDVKLIV